MAKDHQIDSANLSFTPTAGSNGGSWRRVKERVNAYARDPSSATAAEVETAFRSLREDEGLFGHRAHGKAFDGS